MLDWQLIVEGLRAAGPEVHRLLPPCPDARIKEVQSKYGPMPESLVGMLRVFNGAELYNKHGPLITIFGISTVPPLDPLEWAPDWYIDQYTPAWRQATGRRADWAIGMTNYGGLIILGAEEVVREWDTAQQAWDAAPLTLAAWIDKIIADGSAFMRE